MPHRSRVFKTRVLCKKNFPYSGVFNSYSDVLKPYSGVFLQKFYKYKPYSGVFKPYSDVLKPYSNVFCNYGNRVLDIRDASFQHYFKRDN